MIEGYLDGNDRLRGVAVLVDGRHPPTPLDRRMTGWLADRGVPALVVLTKADRVARGRRQARLQETVESLGLDPEQVLWFSSHSGEGRDELVEALSDLLEAS
jgi:GTP-binding protein